MATINDDECRAKAEPDEPVFTLLARDPHAPALVWLWAKLREADGEKRQGKIDGAQLRSRDMRAWAEGKGKPDRFDEVVAMIRDIAEREAGVAPGPWDGPVDTTGGNSEGI